MPTPFEVLGVPVRFDLDEGELHRRFIAASAEHHPDRYTDALEQADAAARSAEINAAYRALKDPEARANAVLAALGGSAKEDDKSLPADLLAEMMEVRERLEEAVASKDQAELRELAEWARRERAGRLEKIAGLLRQAQETGPAERGGVLAAVRLELNALRYVQRMIEQM